MQAIASSAPLELIGIDFLHLDQRSARYQCLLVTKIPSPDLLKPTPQPTKVRILQVIFYAMPLSCVTASQTSLSKNF